MAHQWLTLDGAMNRDCLKAYVTHQLAPALRPGQIVVADNLSSHKSTYARDLLRAQGCDLIFLPPYSPDLNPIEIIRAFSRTNGVHALKFSKLKTVRRENDPPDRFLNLLTPQGRCQNLSSPVEKGRRSLRPVPTAGMPKPLRRSRVWFALKATRSSVPFPSKRLPPGSCQMLAPRLHGPPANQQSDAPEQG